MKLDQVAVRLLTWETRGGTAVLWARNGSARVRQVSPLVVEISPVSNSDCEPWSESEGLSSSVFREHTVESLALKVTGQN